MPRVVNSRLDVAQSDLKAAGINEDAVEILGGGAFGVIDESNWNVCAQEPEPGEAITGKVRLTVDRSCDTEEEKVESTPTATQAEPSESEAPPPLNTFTMPNLVGKNLQGAQDKLQSLGSYVLRQDDATGASRFQVLDSNWKVCSQKPAAGKKVPMEDLVVLSAVKLDENCP